MGPAPPAASRRATLAPSKPGVRQPPRPGTLAPGASPATLAPSDARAARARQPRRPATPAPGFRPLGQPCGSCTAGTLSDAGPLFPAEPAPGEPYVEPDRPDTPDERFPAVIPARPERGATRRHGSGRGEYPASGCRTPHTFPVVQFPQVRPARVRPARERPARERPAGQPPARERLAGERRVGRRANLRRGNPSRGTSGAGTAIDACRGSCRRPRDRRDPVGRWGLDLAVSRAEPAPPPRRARPHPGRARPHRYAAAGTDVRPADRSRSQ